MYIITEPVPGVQDKPDTRDFSGRNYLRVTGNALKVGGFEANPVFVEKVSRTPLERVGSFAYFVLTNAKGFFDFVEKVP